MFNELTQKDIDAMLAEIEHRKCVVRKELLEDVKTARAHGDLSENFEYKAAKQAKNQLLSRQASPKSFFSLGYKRALPFFCNENEPPLG